MSEGDFIKWRQGGPGNFYERQGQIIQILRGSPIGKLLIVESKDEHVIVFPEQIVSEFEEGKIE